METRKQYFVYFAAISANLLSWTAGWGYAWSSPAIPKLNGDVDPENNPLSRPTNIVESTWITSLLNLGSAIGPLAAGKMADIFGRKKTLLMIAVPMLLANIITTFAWTVEQFYVSRFLTGLGCGGIFAVMPLYTAEISEVTNRGNLSCIMGVSMCFWALLCYIISPNITIPIMGYIGLIPLLLFFVVFGFFIPESPLYFVLKNDVASAEKSLQILRKKQSVQKELEEIIRNVENSESAQGSSLDLFTKKTQRKALYICLTVMFFQQFTGSTGISSYLQIFFDETGSSLPSDVCVIVVGTAQVLSLIITSFIVEKFGRKTILISSLLGCATSLIILGVYFFLKSLEFNLQPLFWLPVLCVIVFIIFYNAGMGPVVWIIMAEMYTPQVKSLGSTITTCFNLMLGFVINKFFPIVPLHLGMANTLWGFALFCLLGSAFVYYAVPKTKGKNFEEIQVMLSGKIKAWNL